MWSHKHIFFLYIFISNKNKSCFYIRSSDLQSFPYKVFYLITTGKLKYVNKLTTVSWNLNIKLILGNKGTLVHETVIGYKTIKSVMIRKKGHVLCINILEALKSTNKCHRICMVHSYMNVDTCSRR